MSTETICEGCPNGGVKCGIRGRIDAPIVFIAESPAIQEIKYRRPFVGPGGDLLRKVLPEGFDLDKDALSITAMRCYISSGGNQNESKMMKAVLACQQHMRDLIYKHPRKVIIPLGKWACISVLGDPNFKITQRRGEHIPHDYGCEEEKGCIIAPTYSPPFIMRGSGNLNQWRDDLRNALAVAGFGKGTRPQYIEPVYEVLDTPEALKDFQRKLEQHPEKITIGADIETSGFNYRHDYILCIGLYPDHPNFYISGKPAGYIIPQETLKDHLGAVNNVLGASRAKFVWHNGKFDIKFLWYTGLNRARIDEDTILLSYARDERQGGHDLESLAKDFLGAPSYKHVLKKWAPKKSDSYANVPSPVLYDYLAKDVKNTAGIFHPLRQIIQEDTSLEKLYVQTLLPVQSLLIKVEMRGISTDQEYIALNEKELSEELVEVEHQLHTLVGYNVNPNSPQQVADLLWNKLGLRYKNRKPSGTDKRLLVKFKGHAAVDLIMKYRSITKMLSTYVRPLHKLRDVNNDGRIHTTFSPNRTSTGRLASSEPNIQNVPREKRYKRMYCARPGYIFVEADYNTAELRMLAALSEDEFLTGVFLDDTRNLHDEVAIAMYGENFTDFQRIRAKAINFGIPYGREAFSIAEEFDFPTAEAQRLIDAWFERAPGAKAFIYKCREAPLRGQTLVNAFGRKRRPGVVTQDVIHGLQNEFANFFMQSTVNDICLHAAYKLETNTRLNTIKEEGGIVNLVHDSILIEVPDVPDVIQETLMITKQTMEGIAPKWLETPIQFTVDMKTGTHWGMLNKVK